MSLVGTRPPTLDEWEQYEPHHRARMAFRPGVTGMWQVSGRSNITDFEEVVKLDTKYIPIFIGELLVQGKMSVKVLKTNDIWYGMTYHEDVAAVKDSFRKMLADCNHRI